MGLAELAEALAGEIGQTTEVLGEIRRPDRGEPIRSPPIDRRQRFDEAEQLEPGQRRVQRARAHRPASALLDVLHDGVAVLGPVSEADQDEQGRFGEPPELGDLWLHRGSTPTKCDIALDDIYADGEVLSSPAANQVQAGRWTLTFT